MIAEASLTTITSGPVREASQRPPRSRRRVVLRNTPACEEVLEVDAVHLCERARLPEGGFSVIAYIENVSRLALASVRRARIHAHAQALCARRVRCGLGLKAHRIQLGQAPFLTRFLLVARIATSEMCDREGRKCHTSCLVA